jgi:hypothetical protein
VMVCDDDVVVCAGSAWVPTDLCRACVGFPACCIGFCSTVKRKGHFRLHVCEFVLD